MIRGKVTVDREAVIEIHVAGPGSSQTCQAVIDTGFSGNLTLPSHMIQSLNLPFGGYRRATLADGSFVVLSTYSAKITWHSHARNVLVLHAAGMPLIGTSLLQGSRLTIDMVDDGPVEIDQI